jgi:hypothetical protein
VSVYRIYYVIGLSSVLCAVFVRRFNHDGKFCTATHLLSE